jgi:hypothetical protein
MEKLHEHSIHPDVASKQETSSSSRCAVRRGRRSERAQVAGRYIRHITRVQKRRDARAALLRLHQSQVTPHIAAGPV